MGRSADRLYRSEKDALSQRIDEVVGSVSNHPKIVGVDPKIDGARPEGLKTSMGAHWIRRGTRQSEGCVPSDPLVKSESL